MWLVAAFGLSDLHEVTVLINEKNNRLKLELEGLTDSRISFNTHEMTFNGIPSMLTDIPLLKRLYKFTRWLNATDFDIIITLPGSLGASLFPSIINLLSRKIMFCYLPLVNGSSVFKPSALNNFKDWISIFLLSFFFKIIVVSDVEKEMLSKSVSKKKIKVIKNYFDRSSPR